MLKIAICDDENVFCQKLQKMIYVYMEEIGKECEIDQYSSGMDFIAQGSNMACYTIVFLDINMEKIDGIETAKYLRKLCEDTFVVFVTAFINYTLEGYKVNAFRYLLKNATNFRDTLYECMDSIFQKLDDVPECREVYFQKGKKEILLGRLMYIESNLHILTFYILEKGIVKYKIKDTLNHMQEELNSQNLIRIHQSFLVNLSFVRGIENHFIILTEDIKLPIAKSRYKKVVEAITKYKGVF